VLREDSEDNELVAASLKALCATVSDNLTSPSSSSASARTGGRSPGPLCSDALANDSRSTLLVLSLLHHSDFYVKFVPLLCSSLNRSLFSPSQLLFAKFPV